MEIGTELKVPIEHKHLMYTSLMRLFDPKLHRVDTPTCKFMSRARKELQRAHQNISTRRSQTTNPLDTTQVPLTTEPLVDPPSRAATSEAEAAERDRMLQIAALRLQLELSEAISREAESDLEKDLEHQEQQRKQEQLIQQEQGRKWTPPEVQAQYEQQAQQRTNTYAEAASQVPYGTEDTNKQKQADTKWIALLKRNQQITREQILHFEQQCKSVSSHKRINLQEHQEPAQQPTEVPELEYFDQVMETIGELLWKSHWAHQYGKPNVPPPPIPSHTVSNRRGSPPRNTRSPQSSSPRGELTPVETYQPNTQHEDNETNQTELSDETAPRPDQAQWRASYLTTEALVPDTPWPQAMHSSNYGNYCCQHTSYYKNYNPSASSSSNDPTPINTSPLPYNLSNMYADTIETIISLPDYPLTSPTPPPTISIDREESVPCTDLANINTECLAHEWDTTQDDSDETAPYSYVPKQPSEPPPPTNQVPAPPPPEMQEEDGLPDAEGITNHRNGLSKVTVNCSYCREQYTTGWSRYPEPYSELTRIGWTKGRNKNNNWNWKSARCPACNASMGYTVVRHP